MTSSTCCPRGGDDRVGAAVGIGWGRLPPDDRDPHDPASAEGAAGQPADSVALDPLDHRGGECVVVAEAYEDLVEHDVVEDVDAGLSGEASGDQPGVVAASVDEVGQAWRPSWRSAAYTVTPRARRENSGAQSKPYGTSSACAGT